MKEEYIYYAECSVCKDYYEQVDSIKDARKKAEQHEAEKHKKKLVGIFGLKRLDK